LAQAVTAAVQAANQAISGLASQFHVPVIELYARGI
jgi:hypothetical protein